jgi:hypothetical protein
MHAGFDCGTCTDACGTSYQCGQCDLIHRCGDCNQPNHCVLPTDCCSAYSAQCGTCTNCMGANQSCGTCGAMQECNLFLRCVDCCTACGGPPYTCVTTDNKNYTDCMGGASCMASPMCVTDVGTGCKCCKPM